MYRLTDIVNKLFHLVGWRQSYNPAEHIDASLTESESGQYFQSVHPLLTLDNIRAIMPDDYLYKYPDYSQTKEYAIGDKVQYSDNPQGVKIIWKCIKENTGQIPADDSEYWKKFNFFSDYLEDETKNGITTAIINFLNDKKLNRETKALLERRTFFDGSGRIADTINNRGKLCGYEIVPVRSMGITTKIERIGLQFVGGTGTVKIYLFHSSQIDPVKTFEFEIADDRGTYKWFNVSDCYLPYINDDINAGGSWFLCYDQNELPAGMEAINVSKDWSKEPCGGCNIGNVQTWREMTKYLQISPFMYNAPADFSEYPELWDISRNIYTNATCYGINVEITIGCDLSDFIISQRSIFADVVAKQVGANLLRTMAMNPNVQINRNQSNASRMDILYELDGNTAGQRPGGLGYDLKNAYKALRLDTQKIDRICLSCTNHGVRYRTT